MDKQCNNCISATYPFYADKHPRKRWCSKITQFVCLDGICEFYAERENGEEAELKLGNKTMQKYRDKHQLTKKQNQVPEQLTFNLKGGD